MSQFSFRRTMMETRLALAHSLRRARGRMRVPAILVGSALARRSTRMLIAPQDLRTSDPTFAGHIYSGHFAFGGRIVSVGGYSPFEIEPPSRGWAVGLYGFGWLRHLRAADTALAKAQARALVDDFLRIEHPHPIALETPILARRIQSLVSQSPLLLDGTDLGFYQRFLRALDRHVLQLRCNLAGEPEGIGHLQGAVAACYAAISCDQRTAQLYRATHDLTHAIERQILADGGHISRNPRLIVELALDLLPLRQSFTARSLPIPPAVNTAIDRMQPMIAMFRHSEGSIAQFNGAGVIPPDWLATLASYAEQQNATLDAAETSGYQRIAAGESVLIVDTGLPPPPNFAGQATASTLAFEFSSGPSRIFVNCGTLSDASWADNVASRSTAAHNTACLANASSSRFASQPIGTDVPIVDGPTRVEIARRRDEVGTTLIASHDGYKERFGHIHRRRLSLDESGIALEGEDEFLGAPKDGQGEVALRFHLLPGTTATTLSESRAVLLVFNDGQAWRFDAGGLTLALEESVFFSTGNLLRKTEQIVVRFDLARTPAVVWRLVRLRPSLSAQQTGPDESAGDKPAQNASP